MEEKKTDYKGMILLLLQEIEDEEDLQRIYRLIAYLYIQK